jgi:putative lipoprotein
MADLRFLPPTLALLALTGCMEQQTGGMATDAPAPAIDVVQVYRCNGTLHAVDQMDDAVMVHFKDQARRLGREKSASGVKYGDGQVTFWSKGREATLSYSGQDQHCEAVEGVSARERAELRGVSFRGVGQEPGWYVEVAPGRNILFVGDYGAVSAIAAVPPPITEPGRGLTEYYAMSGDTELSIRIQDQACTDSLSGEQFDATVHVRYGAKEYDGCGRSL